MDNMKNGMTGNNITITNIYHLLESNIYPDYQVQSRLKSNSDVSKNQGC